ncbi:MAG: DUF1289 domain-containing protein [Janthinobacterium lividum]
MMFGAAQWSWAELFYCSVGLFAIFPITSNHDRAQIIPLPCEQSIVLTLPGCHGCLFAYTYRSTEYNMAIKSPCIGVCIFNKPTGYCIACQRTKEECKGWKKMNDDDREQIIDDSKRRKKKVKKATEGKEKSGDRKSGKKSK